MQQSHVLDKEKLKKITNASHTATVAMVMLGFKQRAHSFTNLASFKSKLAAAGEKVIDRDYMDFWRGLESAHVGSVVLGRRGKQTRFEWDYSLRQIARIAIEGKDDVVEKLSAKQPRKRIVAGEMTTYNLPVEPTAKAPKGIQEAPKAKSNQGAPSKEERLVYKIQVRPGYTLEVALPSDVSKEELEKIATQLSQGL